MLRRILLIIAVSFSFFNQAQPALVGIDTTFFSSNYVPDTAYFYTNPQFLLKIQNKGTIPILSSDTVSIHILSDSGNFVTPYIPLNTITVNLSLPFNGSADSVLFNDTILPACFRSGINTVVIWPVVNGDPATTADSLWAVIYVDNNGSGTNLHPYQNSFLMYPNPTKDILNFSTLCKKNSFTKIKIFDLNGRLISETDFKKQIDVSFLKPGFYNISVESIEGEQKLVKFLKE